ncbi:MAG: hypothetical protein MZV49_17235 [Rhodopseudomonas palustris]|nr:hypothetical protein [Rhodopseudomonas palustris]
MNPPRRLRRSADRSDRRSPSAQLHHPRHHADRRLCLAEGPELAGGAARSIGARSGHPRLSRSRERLHRSAARPHRRFAAQAGRRDARPHQGR